MRSKSLYHKKSTGTASDVVDVAVLARMGLLQVGGEQIDAGLDILDVRHLVDRMNVAGRRGESEGGHAAAAALDAAGIGAAAREHLELVFDPPGLGDVAEVAHELGM